MSKMYLSTEQHIRWHTTPQELRELADQMEKQWSEALIGDSVVVRRVFGRPYVVLNIVADQDNMLPRK